jgi:hypothetical protein
VVSARRLFTSPHQSLITNDVRKTNQGEEAKQMRRREREKVIGKIASDANSKHGGPICVRAYETDDKKLDEIAAETGEGKAAIVRRMIRFALSDKQERFGANRCRERLDWLIENERQNSNDSTPSNERLEELLGRVAKVEQETELILQQTSALLRELYLMSSVSVATINIILSRVIQLSIPGGDKQQSMLIADGTMAELIAYAIRDLETCNDFHGLDSKEDRADRLYFPKRVKALKEKAAGSLSSDSAGFKST